MPGANAHISCFSERRKGQVPSSEPEVIEVSSDEDSSDSDPDPSGPFRNARPDGDDLPDLEPDDVEDSFIVEDDEEVPVELPAQFSRQSHQDMSMHFKVICKTHNIPAHGDLLT